MTAKAKIPVTLRYAFLYRYLVRLGFLNGLPGVVIAVMGFRVVFLKCMKVREPERRLGRFDV